MIETLWERIQPLLKEKHYLQDQDKSIIIAY